MGLRGLLADEIHQNFKLKKIIICKVIRIEEFFLKVMGYLATLQGKYSYLDLKSF